MYITYKWHLALNTHSKYLEIWNVFKYSQQLIHKLWKKKDFPEDHVWFKVHPTAYQWNT